MKTRLSYFIFNKGSDYERGCLDNMRYDKNGITVDSTSIEGRGRFLSRVLDSYQPYMTWHRLYFDVHGSAAGSYRLPFMHPTPCSLNGKENIPD